ncbi:hypothetical protein NQZ68_003607 [Dissostichus eleginoides]|nr:hypothetical protein NQZ68_003607 [Dissostichus eleginoides]
MKLMLKIKSSVPVQFVVTSILQISCPIMPVHVVKAWKTILCPQAAATLFKRHLLWKNEVEPPIRASVDIREDQESQMRI